MAQVGEVVSAAKPLADSHIDDPGMCGFFPDPEVRARALTTVADAVGFGAVYVAEVVNGPWQAGVGPESWTMCRPPGR
ncbi:hypothetical protein D5S18_21385 [Nocardia panacis]|uniref:Uncharacterized protein n=1 Tax=Nocardia panacis TaxID=2340916 RepID=A0A3A4K5E4_9NOCA|nr:hypothetical protein [Nocardia panacis]RJO73721.1 hypothetical protein D5S18_21385 [Nocardia panacis]